MTEHSDSAEQISRAVVQMDHLTQQNAALDEQLAAAAGSMPDHTRALSTSLLL
jgi:methyl-accepting chemotaxis protein